MNVTLTPADLISFEEEVCKRFTNKEIRSPFHLDSDNENQLIEIFENYVDEDNYVVGSWRQHFKCLLKGVPPEKLMEAIIKGVSITLCFPEYKVISSSIVGGSISLALGIALGLKGSGNKVVCFLGETTSETGIFHECLKYSTNHELPILWVIEDNGLSVCTPTREVWAMEKLTYEPENYKDKSVVKIKENLLYYKYKSKYPHSGGLERIQF
jgi:TPP-dependent pyruvate/acetoin dehydrogenase alpha subunit